jgi:hypothetical protein
MERERDGDGGNKEKREKRKNVGRKCKRDIKKGRRMRKRRRERGSW